MSRILITGCSSGFGEAIAARFLDEDWEVIATMRTPATVGLPASDSLRVFPLDVTQPQSIEAALAEAGPVDALVNNAGVGMLNVLEGAEIGKARELFEVNVLGTMAMTRAVKRVAPQPDPRTASPWPGQPASVPHGRPEE